MGPRSARYLLNLWKTSEWIVQLDVDNQPQMSPFSRRGGCASIKRSRSFAAQTGWFVNSNKIRCATRIFIRRLRDPLLTTPSAPLRNGNFLLMAQPPLLENGGE